MHISATPALSPTVTTAVPAAADPVEPPATDPAPIDPTTAPSAPTVPPSKFLQKLASRHFNPVADLRHRMRLASEIKDSGLTLPEPSAPHGKGKAYEKFLAAYRAMTGPAPTPPTINPMTDPVTGPPTTIEPAPAVDVAA